MELISRLRQQGRAPAQILPRGFPQGSLRAPPERWLRTAPPQVLADERQRQAVRPREPNSLLRWNSKVELQERPERSRAARKPVAAQGRCLFWQ
jgi:hypothetical protein